MVLPQLAGRSREEGLREMVAFLKAKNHLPRGGDLFQALLQRENLGSTGIGEGVAIPHCKLKGLKEPIVMLAVSREGVSFSAPDGKPSHLFFLVATSPDNPSVNLQILAAIAHLIRKAEALVDRTLAAGNVDAILDIIREEEEKLT